jgi:hypothetical protein
MDPNLLEMAISRLPRTRLWMFSSVMSGLAPAKGLAKTLRKPSTGSAMGMVS